MNKISYGVSMGKLWKHTANGIYYAIWQEDGKTRRKSLETTDDKVAIRRFRNFQRDLISGRIEAPGKGNNVSLYQFAEEFMEYANHSSMRPATCELYHIALDKVKECWGDISLRDISYKDLDNFKTFMKKKKLSSSTVNKNFRHVKAAINKAIKWKYIDKGTLEFPGLEEVDEQLRYLQSSELNQIIEATDDEELKDVYLLAAYTGLRAQELLRLTVNDIDNPVNTIRILSTQKNRKFDNIPISSKAREILNRCMARSDGKGYIFRFKSRSWISVNFKRSAAKVGLEKRFHDLRHTYGSHLAMKGVPLKAIQELMRHASMDSTLVYAKVSPSCVAEMNEALNYDEELALEEGLEDNAEEINEL